MTGRFRIEEAVRRGAKARVALAGPPGSGKTWTSLVLATELAAGGEILVVDTERRSASLYADAFAFKTIVWRPPYDPRELADVVMENAAGFAVVDIDSLSHFWTGRGGTLGIVDDAAHRARGNRFAGWKSGTPAQDAMVDAVLDAPCHVIATMRSKMEYVQEEVRDDRGDRKTQVRRIGMAPIQRDGIEYEFTVTAELADQRLTVTKSRCGLLAGRSFEPGAAGEMGRILRTWLEGAEAPAFGDNRGECRGGADPTAGGLSTMEERTLLVGMLRARPADERAEFTEWLRQRRSPPVGHPDLTAEQAAACRRHLEALAAGEAGAA